MVKRFARTAIPACIALLVAGSPTSAVAEPDADAERADTYLLGVRLDLGMAFGGDDLHAGTLTIGASSGFSAGLGVTVMPLWFDGHGLGINLEAGYKYDGGVNQDGGTSIGRFPLLATIGALLHIVDKVFIRLASGAEWHTEHPDVGHRNEGRHGDRSAGRGGLPRRGRARVQDQRAVPAGSRRPLHDHGVRRNPDVDASNVSLHFAFQYIVL